MIDLVFASPALSSLRHALYHEALESAAILLAVPVQLPTNRWRLLVAEIHVAGEGDYEERSKVAVRLTPSFGLPLEKKAKLNGWSIIYCHTHPWQSGTPRYSSIDDSSEVLLAQYAKARVRNVPHLSLLFGMEHVIGRELGLTNVIRIWEIGSHLECVHDPHETVIERTKHSRQIQAFGEEGQRQVQRLRVAVVGLGGTGSVVVQQLAYLGVTDYILVDPDVIDASNLNRVVGAVPSDIGNKHKVEIAQSIITSQRPHARITIIRDDVLKPDATRSLREAHIVFCCTDSEASRHLLNQFAYQYWIPVIDVGVGIHVQTHAPIQIAGRVAMLSPGLPCLWCLEQLNPANLRRELSSDAHKDADPYFNRTVNIHQPAVISINSTVSSLAVTMFLSAVAGLPGESRFLIYDGTLGRVRSAVGRQDPHCNFCSRDSTAGGGDAYPLPSRSVP